MRAMQERREACSSLLVEESATPPRSVATEMHVKTLKWRGNAEWIRWSYHPRMEAALSATNDSEAGRRIVGVNVNAAATFPAKFFAGGLTPIRPQAKTRRDAVRADEEGPVGSRRKYESSPNIRVGDWLKSKRGRRRDADAARGR